MKLRQIILSDFQVECPNEHLLERYQRERWCVSNFISRGVRKLKVSTNNFNAIVLSPVDRCKVQCARVGSENLDVDMPFDWSTYDAANTPGKANHFLVNRIQEGLEQLREGWDIPVDQILELLESFRASGFVNAWNFKRRIFKDRGLKASMDCRLNLHQFALKLTITKKNKTLFSDDILVTEPDERLWYDLFKDVVIQGDQVVVVDRFADIDEFGNVRENPLFSWNIRNYV